MIASPEIKFPSFAGKEKMSSGFSGVRRFKPASPKIQFNQSVPQPGAQAGTLAGSQAPSEKGFNPLKLGKLFQ